MRIGYARISTTAEEQAAGIIHQKVTLHNAGCDKIVQEEASAVGERPEFDRVLDMLREGDALVVTKLDRMCRSMAHLVEIMRRLEEIGASLHILDNNIDTASPMGRAMLQFMGVFAELERGLILERQKVGIERARKLGKYKGRKKSFSDDRLNKLVAEGLSQAQIARSLGVSRQAVCKRLKELAA